MPESSPEHTTEVRHRVGAKCPYAQGPPVTEVYRTPDERFANLPAFPFEPHYESFGGLRMHFVDEGEGEPVLLLHGEPTWSFLYRKMIPILAAQARVVAPDYFGFGRSDKPTDRSFYAYDSHVGSIVRAVKRLNLTGVTVVMQDWGGPIGLRFAVEHADRVARLVMLNTGLVHPSDRWPTPAFLRWRSFAERTGLDLPIRRIIQGSMLADLTEDVLAGYEAPFPVPRSKVGAAVFPLLVPLYEGDPGMAEMVAVREALHGWEKPALICFGDSDPIYQPAEAHSLARLIPTAAEPEFISGAGHFLQEERGEQIARRILRFLDET